MAMDFSKTKNNVLAKTLEKASESNASIVKDIPIELIEETPVNEYIFGIRDDDVRRLAEEIDESGFTGSIDVIDLHNGKYQVFSGHQRLHAVMMLGWKTIPCTISDDVPEDELLRKLIASNILTRKITPLSYARAISEYKKKVLAKAEKTRGEGRERDKVAKFFNISTGQVPRYEAILKMPKSIQNLCDGFDFPHSQLVNAATFNDKQMAELEEKIIGYVKKFGVEGISNNTINSFIEQIKDKDVPKNTETGPAISSLGTWGHADISGQDNIEDVPDDDGPMMDIPFGESVADSAPAVTQPSAPVVNNTFKETPSKEDNVYYIEDDVNNMSLLLKKLRYTEDIGTLDKDSLIETLN